MPHEAGMGVDMALGVDMGMGPAEQEVVIFELFEKGAHKSAASAMRTFFECITIIEAGAGLIELLCLVVVGSNTDGDEHHHHHDHHDHHEHDHHHKHGKKKGKRKLKHLTSHERRHAACGQLESAGVLFLLRVGSQLTNQLGD